MYLAGPDVFYPNALKHAETLKEICATYGMVGMFPLDAQLDLGKYKSKKDKGLAIYQADISLLNQCDGVIANLNPFRGISADPGTCVEIGYAAAQGKPIFLYSSNQDNYKERAEKAGFNKDRMLVEDFELQDNLMMLGPAKGIVSYSFVDACILAREYWVKLATFWDQAKDLSL